MCWIKNNESEDDGANESYKAGKDFADDSLREFHGRLEVLESL